MRSLRWLGFKFEPRDLWVGVYWTHERHLIDYPVDDDQPFTTMELTLYVCPVPCCVFKVVFYHGMQEGWD